MLPAVDLRECAKASLTETQKPGAGTDGMVTERLIPLKHIRRRQTHRLDYEEVGLKRKVASIFSAHSLDTTMEHGN